MAPIPPLMIEKQAFQSTLEKTLRSQFNRKITIFGCIALSIGVAALAVIKLRTR